MPQSQRVSGGASRLDVMPSQTKAGNESSIRNDSSVIGPTGAAPGAA